MSKQCRNFSQSTDPEDRNAERDCQLMCFLFPDASFPGPLWTWGVILSSSWMNLWQLQWNSGILYFSFCPILVYRSKLYWNMNIVGLGIYSLQVIIWWKLYFLSPQFKWKGFFSKGEKYIDIHSRFVIQQTVQFRVSESPLICNIDCETLLSCYHLLCTVSLQRAPDLTEYGSRVAIGKKI